MYQQSCNGWCLEWSQQEDPMVADLLQQGHIECLGLKLIDFALLHRICGPEMECQWPEPAEIWEERIQPMQMALERLWQPDALLVSPHQGAYIIRDGNHRAEALKRFGYTQYLAHVIQVHNSSGWGIPGGIPAHVSLI